MISKIRYFRSFLALFFILLSSAACSEATLPQVGAELELPTGKKIDLTLEVANTNTQRAKGLMFRKSLPEQHGMIFLFDQDIDHRFWMKNTYISLDLLYINAEFKVVGILERLTPLSEESRGVGVPNRYVVELPAGSVAQLGIKVGSVLKLKDKLPVAVSE